MRLLFLLLLTHIGPSRSVPSGFVEEGVAQIVAITGAFAPNPRNADKPMLLLSAKEGRVRVLEDPDNSDNEITVADLGSQMCTNGERGLQAIRPHPDFKNNRFVYMFYSRKRDGCLEDETSGPRNRLSRFKMSSDTLKIDLGSEMVLLETPPTPKQVHNGGNIAFGNDGKLYVTTGDGGSRRGSPPVSQDLAHLHGSILRINDDGTIPSDNPYAASGVTCGAKGGKTASGGICAEIFAIGLRNPFRLAMDPNTKNKVKFHIGDVGASDWEEISVGGKDYPRANYGWPVMEGPCKKGSHTDCPVQGKYTDPFYYYEHKNNQAGGAVTGSVFVPDGLWPSKYKFLFIDFVFGAMYNLIQDTTRECRSCKPPVPGYRNETFHKQDAMTDMFFGPYKGTQALYIMSRTENGQKVRRIRYTGSSNRSPDANIMVQDTTVRVGETVSFDGTGSSDPDGDALTYKWNFGDGGTSTAKSTQHAFTTNGEFTVTLTVADTKGQTDQAAVKIVVGTPPTAKITSPASGAQFFVGEGLRLVGSAVDSSGKALSSSQLFWEVQRHHGSHYHPFLDRKAGNNFELFPAPDPEDINTATNSYLEVIMYAVDSDGLTTKVSRIVNPKKVNVKIDSVPSGLEVLVDEYPVTTPKTIISWENHELHLDVKDQSSFVFKSWSDGGSRAHSITLPTSSSTMPSFTANFAQASSDAGGSLPRVAVTRDCSTTDKCGRCEGHCQSDGECQGSLVCFKKGGRGKSIPGCIGVDNSNTDWCTISVSNPVKPPTPTPTGPSTQGSVTRVAVTRDCSSTNKCGRCEGHCQSDGECQGSLVCFKKGGRGKSIPGCIGVDNSDTDWCTVP